MLKIVLLLFFSLVYSLPYLLSLLSILPLPSLIGHALQLKHLKRDLETGNIAHAYLFAGPESVGKTTVAKWFAQELLTRSLSSDAKERIQYECEHFIHPDYFILDQLWIDGVCDDWSVIARSSNVPQEDRAKRKVKTNIIGVEDVRELSKRLQSVSSGGYRVCILCNVERLHPVAANAFLKILEEPPKNVIFLLTAHQLTDVLPTVVSRTRLVHFAPVSRRLLEEKVNPETEDGAILLSLVSGAPGKLHTLLKDPALLIAEKKYAYDATVFWRTMTLSERQRWLLEEGEKKDVVEKKMVHLGLALQQRKTEKQWQKAVMAYHRLSEALLTNVYRPIVFLRFTLELEANQC